MPNKHANCVLFFLIELLQVEHGQPDCKNKRTVLVKQIVSRNVPKLDYMMSLLCDTDGTKDSIVADIN